MWAQYYFLGGLLGVPHVWPFPSNKKKRIERHNGASRIRWLLHITDAFLAHADRLICVREQILVLSPYSPTPVKTALMLYIYLFMFPFHLCCSKRYALCFIKRTSGKAQSYARVDARYTVRKRVRKKLSVTRINSKFGDFRLIFSKKIRPDLTLWTFPQKLAGVLTVVRINQQIWDQPEKAVNLNFQPLEFSSWPKNYSNRYSSKRLRCVG